MSAEVNAHIRASNIPSDKTSVGGDALLVIDGVIDFFNSRSFGMVRSSSGDGTFDISMPFIPRSSGTHTYGIQLSRLTDFPENRLSTGAKLSATAELKSNLDLSVGSVIATQNGLPLNRDSNGVFIADPNSTVHIEVPISGTGFINPETRFTTVTLQAGSQLPQSMPVSLANIQSARILMIAFDVTFGPLDAGIQTITATVDPGMLLKESDVTDNAAKIQVRIQTKYKLTAKVQGPDGNWHDVLDLGSAFAVNPSDFVFNTKLDAFALGGAIPSQPQKLQLGCIDVSTFPPTPVSGCKFQIQPLSNGSKNGGHLHSKARPFILGDTESMFAYDGALHSVDVTGQSLIYWPPIVSGDVLVKINGFDRDGNPIESTPPITFSVRVPDLVPLSADTYDLKCVLAPNTSGCPGGGYQHESFYSVTSEVNKHMSKIATDYDILTPSDPNNLVATDASLILGGLYDLGDQYGHSYWSPPHKYHRQGTDIDIRRTIADEDKFEKVVCLNGGYPYDEDDAHYHLFFYTYSAWIKNLCSTEE
jgi:hypothetical protein